MSQQNNYPSLPIFNYSSEPFYPDPPRVNHNAPSFPSNWSGQRSRPTSVADATTSSHFRTSRTMPNPKPASLRSFDTSSMSHQASRIDPNLASSLLQVPRPRSALDNLNAGSADPITRFYSDSDGPWSSQRVGSATFSNGRSSVSQHLHFNSFRGGPRSEVESLAPRSDSGYYTHQTLSVSNDPDRCDQELPQELFRVRNINVGSAPSEITETHPNPAADQRSQFSGRSTTNGKEFECHLCHEVSKCRSDHKKHMLKHEKPFKCDVPNCRRGGKGFTTVNDLNRHKKSVHHIGALQDSYQCASDNCRNKDKIWPRLDNFKQHINRMHHDEDESDLIRRSKYEARQTASAETPSVAPMDTTLAGIAPDRQFSNPGFEDPVNGMSLTPVQASNTWTSYVVPPGSSQDFALDVDQSDPTPYDQSPSKPNVPLNTAQKAPGQIRGMNLDANAAPSPRVANQRNSLRLDTLATVASSQSSPEKSMAQPPPAAPPQLSREPQTKAEQQKRALQTLSKALAREIQSSASVEPSDLENVVLRGLHTILPKLGKHQKTSFASSSSQGSLGGSSTAQKNTSPDDAELPTTTQVVQAIVDLTKNGSKRQQTSNRPKPVSGNMKACDHCDVTLARSCDMRKHMKRHTKPYGCTYPKCHKRFGAKSDWKRHENSQHFQLESYRCQLLSQSTQIPCGDLFYRQELFQQHLKDKHKKTDQNEIEQETKRRRIGRNGQGQFWCGFCFKIVRLEKKRSAAWDERFDHIDNHFMKERRHIEEWHCMQAKKTKGELLKEMDKNIFEEEDDGDASMGNETSPTGDSPTDEPHHHHHPPPSPPPPQQQAYNPSSMAPPPPPLPRSPSASAVRSNKRHATSDPPGPSPPNKHAKTAEEPAWFCCQCGNGPFNFQLYTTCMNNSCEHHACQNCPPGRIHI